MQLLAKLKKNLFMGFRATLIFLLIGLFLHASLSLGIARPVAQLKWSEGITTYL